MFDNEDEKGIAAEIAANPQMREIIFRKGDAPVLLPPIAKQKLVLEGTVDSVIDFINKRKHLFDKDKCHLKFDTGTLTVQFVGNEQRDGNEYETLVTGRILKTARFQKLKINTDTSYRSPELAKLLRGYKNFFADGTFTDFMQQLNSFTTKKNETESRDYSEKSKSATNQKSTTADNMPEYFVITMPILVGCKPVKMTVILDLQVTGEIALFCYELESEIESQSNEIFKEVEAVGSEYVIIKS